MTKELELTCEQRTAVKQLSDAKLGQEVGSERKKLKKSTTPNETLKKPVKKKDKKAILEQEKKEAQQWYTKYGKKYGLLPVSNQNLIKAPSGCSVDNLENVPETVGLVSTGLNRQWVLETVLDCVIRLREISNVEQVMYSNALVDSLDFNRAKPMRLGLFDEIRRADDVIAYEEFFSCVFDLRLFNQFRNFVKSHCLIFGLGSTSTKDYHDLLLHSEISQNAFGKGVLLKAKDALIQTKRNASSFTPCYIPAGPLDQQFFVLN